jgi:hypothetical protein
MSRAAMAIALLAAMALAAPVSAAPEPAPRFFRIAAAATTDEPAPTRAGLTPHELFATYLSAQGVDDERVMRLFTRLYDEATGSGT